MRESRARAELDPAHARTDRVESKKEIRRRPNDRVRRLIQHCSAACAFASAATFGTAACAIVSQRLATATLTNLQIMSSILEEIETKIAGLKTSTTKSNVGVVRETGDGVARIEGLSDAMLNEMIEFPNGVYRSRAQPRRNRSRRDSSRRQHQGHGRRRSQNDRQLLQVPVGKALLGRVVNTLGQPLDGKGPDQD